MHTDPKSDEGRDVALKPQIDAEAFMAHFFSQLRLNVPGFAATTSVRVPTEGQKAAVAHFNAAGTGLAVKDFRTIAAYLPTRHEDGSLHVDVPAGAVTARVYSKKAVTNRSVEPCQELVLPCDSGWVARIEFLDGKGVVIEATGSEPPLNQPAD